jgi:hypothetical protein
MFRQITTIPTQAERTAALARRWESLCDELHDPAVELDTESFSLLLSTFKALRAAGHAFDRGTVALMAVLERQAAETFDGFEDDTDSDEDAPTGWGCEMRRQRVDVYLLHFAPPLKHAAHYLGSTALPVAERVEQHLAGNGSPLVAAAVAAGCKVTLARVWRGGGRELEAKFKRRQHNRCLCPLCRTGAHHAATAA